LRLIAADGDMALYKAKEATCLKCQNGFGKMIISPDGKCQECGVMRLFREK